MEQVTLAQAKAWLRELPTKNALKAAEMMYAHLGQFSLPADNPPEGFAILELFEPTAKELRDQLRKQYLSSGGASSEQKNLIGTLSQNLESRYATNYVSLLNSLATWADSPQKNLLHAKTCHYAMFHLLEILVNAYCLYQEAPANLWSKLHKLYLLAVKHKIDRTSLTADEVITSSLTSVENVYKHCLLLACAHPFQLRLKEIEKLQQGLLSWSSLCEISESNIGDNLFVVSLDTDNPPRYTLLDPQEPSPTTRFLNTAPVIQHLTDILKQQYNVELAQRIVAYLSRDLLGYLVDVWGELYKRRYERSPLQQSVTICMGLSACHYFLSEKSSTDTRGGTAGEEVDQSSLELVPVENEESLTRGFEKTRAATQDPTKFASTGGLKYKTFSWTTVNSDPQGYCLATTEEKLPSMQAGELIGLLQTGDMDDDQWYINVIRWLKRTQDELQMGIQLLSTNAIAVSVKIQRPNPTEFFNALLLPEFAESGQKNSLIVPAIDFKLGDIVHVVNPTFDFLVSLTKITSTSDSYCQIEFKTISPEKPTLKQSAPVQKQQDNMDEDDVWGGIS